MSTGRKILIVLCLAGIFVAGGATGAFVALRVAHHIAEERSLMHTFVPRQFERLKKELNLTSEQQEKVDKILREGTEQISTLRRESIRAGAVRIREMNQKISAILTPEQQAKFEEFLKKQRERIRRFQAERGERRGPPNEPREGPPPPPANP